MEHEVLFRDIAAAELKVRCTLEVEALGELFIKCQMLFCYWNFILCSDTSASQPLTLRTTGHTSYCKNILFIETLLFLQTSATAG